MKKVLYTLALDGYPSEMTVLTFPWIKRYAEKIGAEFQVIHERKNPAWPPTYEKTQIWDLGKDNDWSVFIDADALINPELFDVTAVVPKDTVLFTGQDMANMRFKASRWDLRDQRFLGACTWFVVCSDVTIDLWKPFDRDFFFAYGLPDSEDPADLAKAVISQIFPTNAERNCRIGDGSKAITSDKLIEDFLCSQNMARFGLKHQTIEAHLKMRFGRQYDSYYWHQYTINIDEKILQCLSVMNQWGLINETPEAKEKYGDLLRKIQSNAKRQAEQMAQMQAMGPMGPMRPM